LRCPIALVPGRRRLAAATERAKFCRIGKLLLSRRPFVLLLLLLLLLPLLLLRH